MKNIRLFAFPFAGGSKYSFNQLKHKFPPFIDFQPVELPGRGERMTEPLLTNIHQLADDVFQQINGQLDTPYAIYGHSMGTLLGYLVTKKIAAANQPLPLHLFFSGSGGPSAEKKEKNRYLLPKDQFKAKLEAYGGSPKEVLEDEGLFDFFEPILRADFQAVETYRHEQSAPLDIPVTSMIGLNETVSVEDAKLWQKETTGKVSVRQFPGGHFFIFDHLGDVAQIIAKELQTAMVS